MDKQDEKKRFDKLLDAASKGLEKPANPRLNPHGSYAPFSNELPFPNLFSDRPIQPSDLVRPSLREPHFDIFPMRGSPRRLNVSRCKVGGCQFPSQVLQPLCAIHSGTHCPKCASPAINIDGKIRCIQCAEPQ